MPASWLSHAGAFAMLATVTLGAARLVAGGLRRMPMAWDAELLHLAMGVSMAGMLDGRLAVFPAVAWLAVFGGGGVWFAWRCGLAARRVLSRQAVGHGLVLVGGCAAMTFMLLVVPPSTNMTDMAELICGARMLGMPAGPGTLATAWTWVALGLGVVLLAGAACLLRPRFRYAATPTDARRTSAGVAAPLLTSTRLAVGAQFAMCVTMTAMLVALYR